MQLFPYKVQINISCIVSMNYVYLSNACSCEMVRCEGECGVSPIGSTIVETNNLFPSINDKIKEASNNVITSRRSDNSLKDHNPNVARDLISLESPRHTYLANSLSSSENLSNSHHQKTTISTQTPSSSNEA